MPFRKTFEYIYVNKNYKKLIYSNSIRLNKINNHKTNNEK